MSRKQKMLRAFLHQHENGCADSWRAGWNAQKGLAHAKTIQAAQAENERLQRELRMAMAAIDGHVAQKDELQAERDEYRRLESACRDLLAENADLRRRLERWQKNETQIGTNRQVKRLLAERDMENVYAARKYLDGVNTDD